MRKKGKKFCTIIGAGALFMMILTGCSSNEPSVSRPNQNTSQPVSMEPENTSANPADSASSTSAGDFTTQDVYGNSFDKERFQDYDLTLVNVFTTWCTPCVEEMPDLEKLYQQMKDKGVNVVGVMLDMLNEKGEIVQSDLERAQTLVERTGVTYPVLLPDSTYMNGRLIGIEGFPETFFIDKNGNLIGETYSGSRSLEDWLSIVEQELASLKEDS